MREQKRVLIIEDNVINLELFTDLLEAAGITVLSASDADLGMETARTAHPDLILMDIALPGTDGLAAAQRLRADAKTAGIPIVALTAHAMKGDAERAYAAGCVGYITKPINTRSFPRVVLELCDGAGKTVTDFSASEPTIIAETTSAVETKPVANKSENTEKAEQPVVEGTRPTAKTSMTIIDPLPTATKTVSDNSLSNGSGIELSTSGISKRAKKRTPVLWMPEQTPRILVVDDDPMNREVLADMLTLFQYESVLAASGEEALNLVGNHIDLVLMDVMMPGMDGCATTRAIRDDLHIVDLPVIMVTALSDREERIRAVEAGANDFITKPVDRTELRARMASLLRMKTAQDALKKQRAELESTVRIRTADLRKTMQQITAAQQAAHQAHLDTMHRMALAAEFRDGASAPAHIRCVGSYCAILAKHMGLSENAVEVLNHAAPIHDIGLIGIPDAVLLKRGDRTPSEEDIYRQHTTIGARILSGSSAELLRAGEVIAMSHHERWDGSGYPRKLVGEDIPLYGRICAVADTFDTLTAYKPNQHQHSNESARELLESERAKGFDPRVLDALQAGWDEILMLQARFHRADMPPAEFAMNTVYAMV